MAWRYDRDISWPVWLLWVKLPWHLKSCTLRWKHMGFLIDTKSACVSIIMKDRELIEPTKYIKHWEYAHALFLKSALNPLLNMFLSHHLAQAHRRGRREGRSAGRPRSRPAWLRTSATGHEGTAHRDLQTGWGWGLPTFMLVNNMIQYQVNMAVLLLSVFLTIGSRSKMSRNHGFSEVLQIFCSSLMEVDSRNHNK